VPVRTSYGSSSAGSGSARDAPAEFQKDWTVCRIVRPVGSTVGGGHVFSVVSGESGSPGTCATAATWLRSSAGGGGSRVVYHRTLSVIKLSLHTFFCDKPTSAAWTYILPLCSFVTVNILVCIYCYVFCTIN